HPVARHAGLLHAEIDAAVLDIHVELLEGALVEQELEPLARGELAALVLRLDARRAAARARLLAADFKLFKDFFHAGSPCEQMRAGSIAWADGPANGRWVATRPVPRPPGERPNQGPRRRVRGRTRGKPMAACGFAA